MARLLLTRDEQKKFLEAVRGKTGLTFTKLATHLRFHPRTLNNWVNVRTSIEFDSAVKLSRVSGVPIPSSAIIKEDFWHTSRAGRRGGIVTKKKHGNPGTPEGRSTGGKRSVVANIFGKTGFRTKKTIRLPTRSSNLAEFFGIVLGDGSITDHQVSITLNKTTDRAYALWVRKHIAELFDVYVSERIRENTTILTVSSVGLVEYLEKQGLQCGSKVLRQADVPKWIKRRDAFARAFVRGIVDTDGCIYVDKHHRNGTEYRSICLAFTNASVPLLRSVLQILEEHQLNPREYERNIKIRKQDSVVRYWKAFGFHNPKHENKVMSFLEEYH